MAKQVKKPTIKTLKPKANESTKSIPYPKGKPTQYPK